MLVVGMGASDPDQLDTSLAGDPTEVGVLGPVADVLLGKASQQVPGGRFDREAQ